MRAVRANGVVADDGTVTLRTDEPLQPGAVEAVLVLMESGEPSSRIRVVEATADVLREISGCVELGGDALADTELLYDHG